jgi:UDP-N-acetylglucosamine 4,6-dehydratase (inverting)
MLNNKKIIVIGATGSFGQSFVKYILEKFKLKKLICYSRDETKQYEMSNLEIIKKNKKIVRFFIGDVRDLSRLKFAMEDVDIVIHAAALKQVSIGEYNPFEVIKTNVIGAQNVIEASLRSNVKKVIALSTDKAAAPINLYGASKLCSDKLFTSANFYTGRRSIKFSVVRYGNVLGSRGSVVPLFLKNKKKNIFHITDERMTRFNITLNEGVKFVLDTLKVMQGGEIFVPKIPSYKITDIVKAISKNPIIRKIGIRPGEKLHEEMITHSDSMTTYEFDKYYIIFPHQIYYGEKLKKYLKNYDKPIKSAARSFSYSSDKNSSFLTINQIKNLIEQNL